MAPQRKHSVRPNLRHHIRNEAKLLKYACCVGSLGWFSPPPGPPKLAYTHHFFSIDSNLVFSIDSNLADRVI